MSIIRADSIKSRSGNGAPTAPNGLIVTGICTATSFVGSGTALTGIDAATLKFGGATKAQAVSGGVNITGDVSISGALGVAGVLTYEDVTNVDSIGVITARDGLRVTGIATATAFHGDGSQLTGIAPGSPVGGASTNTVFFENDNSVDVNYSITSGKNAMAAGPIAIKSGVTVTVPSGSFLTIV